MPKNQPTETTQLELHVQEVEKVQKEKLSGFGTNTIIDWFGIKYTLTEHRTFTENDMKINQLANAYWNALEKIASLQAGESGSTVTQERLF